MKVLAIIDVKPGADLDHLRAELPLELKGSWALFSAGVIREAYATDRQTRIAFVLETEGLASAEAHLRTLPLVGAGLLTFELIELRAFVNWGMLFAPSTS